MDLTFILNTTFALAVLAGFTLANMRIVHKTSLQWRLFALGLSFFTSISIFSLMHLSILASVISIQFAFVLSCWVSGILYLSFLVDMTSIRRSRYFFISYLSTIPLSVISLMLPRPGGVYAIIAVATSLVFGYSWSFLSTWIRSATDDRARRDGEWIALVFVAYGLGLLICFFHALTGFFWVLVLWYGTVFYTVNHLGLFRNLTNRENQLILDNVFDVVIILDTSGHILRMNRRGFQITEFPVIELTGNGIETVIKHPELTARNRRLWLEQHGWLDTGINTRRSPSIDAVIKTRFDEEIPVDLRVVCLVNLAREKTGYIVSASDMRITRQLMKEITDREYAARDLALSENKFSRMFIFNPVGIMIVDLETMEITDANPAIEEIFGCETSCIVRKKLFDIGLEMDALPYAVFLDKMQMEGSVPEFPAKIVRQTGEVRKCRLSAVSFDLNKARRILVSVADITSEEDMRDALLRKQKVETIGILAGGIAHDFNNILAVILGHIGLTKMRVVDPHARGPIEKAEKACLRAREMTGQLLAFSRGGKPIIGVCDTPALITDSAMLSVSETAVACLFDFPLVLWPLQVDRIQVGQVISNLVRNSVEAMGNSGIIDIRAVNADFTNFQAGHRPVGPDSKPIAPGPYVEIRIHDQGPGIPEQIRDKIFDPFFTTKKSGTGLGLSIVFSVVQNHGGAITISSAKDGGAVFSLYLPAQPDGSPEAQETQSPLGHQGKRVLLMDDDPEVRDTARGMLSSLGCTVITAQEGSQAVRLYREALSGKTPFDFCILDLIIPTGMSGVRCAQEILAMDRSAVLLVSSGYSDDPVLSRWREYGFKGVIPKPYTLSELDVALANVLVNR